MTVKTIDTTLKETPKSSYHGFEPKLQYGYKWDEVVSSLQKSARRGLEFDTCFWAAVLYKSGYSQYLARRLRTVAMEDIGIANPAVLILANQLYQDGSYKKIDKKFEQAQLFGDGFLPYVNLILLLCRSQKSRIADEITNIIFDGLDKGDLHLEIPDYAKDVHTDAGKVQYGRWDKGTIEERHEKVKLWFDTWAKIDNEVSNYEIQNPYNRLHKAMLGYFNEEYVLPEGEKHHDLNTVLAGIIGKTVKDHETKAGSHDQ